MDHYVSNYLSEIIRKFTTGVAKEHSYRPALEQFIETIGSDKKIDAINEPTREAVGAPDFIIRIGDIPLGYIEAKDIGINRLENLDTREQEQLERYRHGFDNLIYTDYLEFIFYKSGENVSRVRIANFDGHTITPIPENFAKLENLIRDFLQKPSITIKSPAKLADMMAGKARLVADVIKQTLTATDTNTTLSDQFNAFKQLLIHDISIDDFADIYAQTIAYGMFAARLNDTTLKDFSRQEAAVLIPKTNPFLRNLFGYIAGPDIDERIVWVVDSLANIFKYTDVAHIMRNFGRETQTQDPIIHFYETFLAAYNPDQRKKRGVFYTPQPVVNYIIRSVDTILKRDFDLPMGLADKSKITKKIRTQGTHKLIDKEFHRIQVLDPATGTGTFLAEIIKYIHDKYFNGETGLWTKYVDSDLLPRIHGFELLMASYAMAHLKLDLVLRSTGWVQDVAPINDKIFRQDDLFDTKLAQIGRNTVIKNTNRRLGVYLTNSLEEADPNTNNLPFTQWLSNEAREANIIKADTPVMCIIGNPPYSVSSSNNNDFARKLIERYKTGLNERNIQPLSDDYIKFIALGQHYIERNGTGILAFITNNSFIDGVIHRQMRKSLMETFDDIYILNLHGNSNIGEISPDGTKDENVFGIQQGVSINIFVKKTNRNSLAHIHFAELFGLRGNKYAFLSNNTVETTDFQTLKPTEPNYFFVKKDLRQKQEYDEYFSICDMFSLNNLGIQTKNDKELISFTPFDTEYNTLVSYRPFDIRYINYDKNKVARPSYRVMQHMEMPNVALIATRQFGGKKHFITFITKHLTEIGSQPFASYILFPLYTYFGGKRESNLDQRIVRQIESIIGHDAEPLDIFDYIYGVLHNPTYREKYHEFLKIDFPRIPYPKNDTEFRKFAEIGGKLRKLHLMENLPSPTVKYPASGTDIIDRPRYENGRVYINDTQYFDGVSDIAWNFFVGGYQPAQKWLKDRRGRTLTIDDIIHYKNVITVLDETYDIMQSINTKTEK